MKPDIVRTLLTSLKPLRSRRDVFVAMIPGVETENVPWSFHVAFDALCDDDLVNFDEHREAFVVNPEKMILALAIN
jgi:hypothetical protein